MENHQDGEEKRTRRDFLKSAAATTAGALVGSYALQGGRAMAQEDAPKAVKDEAVSQSVNDRIYMGVIGTGGMGSSHIRSFIQLHKDKKANVEIVALCDVAKPKLDSNLKATEEKQGTKVKGYKDYRELLDSKDVDAVLIASPEHWHAQMAIDAMEAGKDVYVEKPMTLRLDGALRLYNSAIQSKQILEVGTQYVMEDKYHKAMELIAAGAIGHPTSSQTSYCRNSKDGEWLYYEIKPELVPGPNLDWRAWCGPLGLAPWNPEIYARWRRYRKYSTGIVGDLLVHMMTPLVMAVNAGWPVKVTAVGGHYVDKKMENHDQVNITVQFEKNHTLVVAGSTCNEQGLEPMIRGHMGNIYLSGGNMKLTPERLYAEEVDEEQLKLPGGNPHDAIRLNFLECCRTRKMPAGNVDLATKVMVIVDLATRSMWEGKTFTFSPWTMTAKPA